MPSVDASNVVLFSGSSHPQLAQEVADYLGVRLGNANLTSFPDGETFVQINENVRNRDCFIVQSVALQPNEYLMELLVMIDALKRASARSVAAVIPYFGYCRQDRKDRPRVPITAKLVANMLEAAGVDRVVTMDLHADQLQGFFDVPVDNLYGRPALVCGVKESGFDDFVVVTPDIGSIKLARAYAIQLGTGMAIVDKRRVSATEVEVTTVIGDDVNGRNVLLVDDMISTGGTLVNAAQVCKDRGAREIRALATHGLLVGKALEKIEKSPIEKVLVSNTIAGRDKLSSFVETVSVGYLLGEAIRCICSAESISSLFEIRDCNTGRQQLSTML
ncbi:MAG: ribose-phosphate pyrophosphokinase [Chlamydiia bacterium]|nr:ribose-phosphate pyrophosphokinase [Chlamydiia bacterium]